MKIVTKKIRAFDPDITFNSGQCFRWKKTDNTWSAIADGRYVEVKGSYPNVNIMCNFKDVEFWSKYFDSEYD